MSRWLPHVPFRRLFAALLALSPTLYAAPPEWAGGNGGNTNANNGNNWSTGSLPGNSDLARLANGKMTLVAPLTFGALEFTGGTIDGTGSLTLSLGTSLWTGGDIDTATVNLNGTTIGAGAAKKVHNNAQLNLAGTTQWSGSDIATASAGKINNAGVFTAAFDGKISHESGTRATFTNTGTFKKSGSAGLTLIETIFQNSNTVEVATGTLQLSGGGSSSGTLSIASGATLQTSTNDYTFSGNALNGAGTIDVAGGTTTFNGTSGSASLKVSGGKAKVTGSHSTTGSLTLAGGTLEGSGTDTTSASGGFNWTAGDISGTAVTSTGNGTIGAGGNKKLLNGAQLNLSGTTSWTGDNIATAGSTTVLKNTGTFATNTDGTIANEDPTGGRATFRNEGTFRKTNTTSGGTTQIETKFDNIAGANVTIDGGSLKLLGGGSNAGNVNVAGGAKIVLSGNDYAFTGGTLTGAGSIDLESATTTFGGGTTGSANLRVKGGTAKFTGTHSTTGSLFLESGKIDGTSTASVGTLDWSGGDIATATVNATNALIGGNNAKKISDGAKLNVSGATSWTTGNITTAGSATTINNAGAFSVSGDNVIANADTPANRATFKNEGSFTKVNTTSSGTTEVQTKFDNNSTGTVDIQGGKLKLGGGGTSTGNVTVASGATIEVTGNDYNFGGGTLNGAGTIDVTSAVASFNATTGSANLKVSGGTAKFDGAHATSGKLTLGSGSVTGNGNATVGGFDWTGGTVDTKISSAGGTFGGGPKTLSGSADLTLAGNTTWDGSTIAANGAGKIKTASGATFTATNDGAITNGSTGTFTNLGTFEKTGGALTATDIQVRFESSGEIKAHTGTLKLSGGGHSSSTVTIGNGAKLEISGANFAFNGGAIDGASGKLQLSDKITSFTGATSGTAELALVSNTATANFDGTHAGSGKLSLLNGTVGGTGTADFSALDWSGGSLNATIKSTGNATIGGTNAKFLGGDLTLGGDTTWNGSSLHATGAAKIKNEAGKTFTTSADGILSNGGTATFTNLGTFEKTAGVTGGATEIQAKFDSSGTIKATGGTLKLLGGGNATGNVNIAAAGKLQVAGANYTFDGAALSGDGTLELTGATTTFKGASGSGKISVNGGNASFDSSQSSASKLTLLAGVVSSTNDGSADVGTLEWNAGTLNAKVKANNATLGSGAKVLSSTAELTLTGATSWNGSQLHAEGAGKIKNDATATFTTGTDGILSNGGTATFTNLGIFEKNGGTGGATEIHAKFDNSGTLKATNGNLKLAGGGTSSGTVNIGTNGKLQIAGTDYLFDGAAFTGAGTIELTGATTKFKGSSGSAKLSLNGGNAELDTSLLTAGSLTLSIGSINSLNGGSADVGTFDWRGGTLNAKVKTAGATLGGGSKTLSTAAELLLGGNTSWDGSQINAGGNAKIRNEAGGVFTASSDGLLANSGSAVFTNDGTFVKSNGAAGGSTQIHARFENNGLVKVDSGKLHLSGGGKNAANASILVAAAAALEIDGDLELAANSTLNGNGLGRLLNGTLTAHGSVGIKNFIFDGGSLAGTNTFHGTVDWNAGNWNSIHAEAVTTIASGAVLHFRGNSTHDFNNRSILNDGTVNWHSGNLRGGNGSAFINNSVFNDLNGGNKSISHPGTLGGSASFTNNGEYHKTQGGTTTVDIPFTNNGSLKVASGTLVFSSTFTNHGSVNLTNGATATFATPLVFGASSPLTGVGTITAPSVTAGGIVAPGVSPGMLTVTGDLTLIATSSLLIELGGPTPGTDYDVLNIGGAGLLAGTLGVTFLNGYQWQLPANATFTVVTSNGLTGAFANIGNAGRMLSSDGTMSFQVNYGLGSAFSANSVVLSNFVVAVPEPSTYVLMGLGGIVILLSLRRRRK